MYPRRTQDRINHARCRRIPRRLSVHPRTDFRVLQGHAQGSGETLNSSFDGAFTFFAMCVGLTTTASHLEIVSLECLRDDSAAHMAHSRKVQRNTIRCPRCDTAAKEIRVLCPDRTANHHRACKHRPVVGITHGDAYSSISARTFVPKTARTRIFASRTIALLFMPTLSLVFYAESPACEQL